ncbi:MAG: hypothetical protein ACI8Y7_000666 [Candidatus Woesearchaeota archaeon]|jgi:hypothetical protein
MRNMHHHGLTSIQNSFLNQSSLPTSKERGKLTAEMLGKVHPPQAQLGVSQDVVIHGSRTETIPLYFAMRC